jgi:hypothetical protein
MTTHEVSSQADRSVKLTTELIKHLMVAPDSLGLLDADKASPNLCRSLSADESRALVPRDLLFEGL